MSTGLDKFFKLGVGLAAWLLVISIMAYTFILIQDVIILVGIAVLFSYVLLAPVNGIEAILFKLLRFPGLKLFGTRLSPTTLRALTILSVYFVFLLSSLVISVRLLPEALNQLHDFSLQVPQYLEKSENWVLSQRWANTLFQQELDSLSQSGSLSEVERLELKQDSVTPQSALTQAQRHVIHNRFFNTQVPFTQYLKTHSLDTVKNVLTIVTSTLSGFVFTFTIGILMFYFLLEGAVLKTKCLQWLPVRYRDTMNTLVLEYHQACYGFVKGQVMLGMVTGLYMFFVYSAFGVPYALFLASFFAISEVIPVVGTWIGFTPGIIVLFFLSPVKLAMVMGLSYFYQTIKDNFVAPRVIGHTVGLHPIVVFLSILICAKLAGFVGILFAIPLASLANVLLRFATRPKL
jgi:predicted PurR-regulated permease PerM